MRGFYLHPAHDGIHGCRGGVGHSPGAGFDESGASYELEIGNNAEASFEMIAYLVLKDEILEFLQMQDSVNAQLILATYRQKIEEINQKYEEKETTSN